MDRKDEIHALFEALRQESADTAPPEGLKERIFARIDQSEQALSSEDLRAIDPDVEPDIEGWPVGHWLRRETTELVSERSSDWPSFSESVMARVTRAPALESSDVLAPEAEGVSIRELLLDERSQEMARMEGKWTAFAAQIMADLDRRASDELDAQAVDLLRAEVDREMHVRSPDFEEHFKHEVDRRIFNRGRAGPSLWERLQGWWAEHTAYGWGLGATAAAAAVLVVAMPRTPGVVGPGTESESAAHLSGEVLIDAIAFEGDVIMYPDEGVTVVLLSGV